MAAQVRRLERAYWWLGWLKAPFWGVDRLLRILRLLPREIGGPGFSVNEDPVGHACSCLWAAAVAFNDVRIDVQGQVLLGEESKSGPRLHLPGLVIMRSEFLLRGRRCELVMGDIKSWMVLQRCDADGIHVTAEPRS